MILIDGATRKQVASVFTIDDPNYHGGVRVALADINGDGHADLVAGAGVGGGSRVVVYDGLAFLQQSAAGGFTFRDLAPGETPAKLVQDFYAFADDPGYTGGVFLAAGDIDGDGKGDVVAGAGAGGGRRVRILNGADLLAGKGANAGNLANFDVAGNTASVSGVRVAVKKLDADQYADVVVGDGADGPSRVYLGKNVQPKLADGVEPAAETDFNGLPANNVLRRLTRRPAEPRPRREGMRSPHAAASFHSRRPTKSR